MAVVPLIEKPKGALRRYAWRYSRKVFAGQVADPVKVQAHHTGVLLAAGALETVVDKRWKALDADLALLAVQAAAGQIGCAWCMDYSYFVRIQDGVDERKVRDVTRWRDSDAYDDRERAVLAYVEAVCATPATLPEEVVADLHRHFSDEQVVELAAWVALENYRSRFNAGVGLVSQGFREHCEVPATSAAARG